MDLKTLSFRIFPSENWDFSILRDTLWKTTVEVPVNDEYKSNRHQQEEYNQNGYHDCSGVVLQSKYK